jgi:phosphatidylserine/phosphatidylglycerophosphate/cardiolipin synthase-like enzyme
LLFIFRNFMQLPLKKSLALRGTLIGTVLLAVLFLRVVSGCASREEPKIVKVCFTPGEDCLSLIKKVIAKAEDEILVQAYVFTSRPIATALANAYKKGVMVKVLVDRSQLGHKGSQLKKLLKAGVAVWVDDVAGIAHNKVMILDKNYVVTGSYNWTASAEYDNAENIVVIDHEVTNRSYRDNWEKRLQGARKISQGDLAEKV